MHLKSFKNFDNFIFQEKPVKEAGNDYFDIGEGNDYEDYEENILIEM